MTSTYRALKAAFALAISIAAFAAAPANAQQQQRRSVLVSSFERQNLNETRELQQAAGYRLADSDVCYLGHGRQWYYTVWHRKEPPPSEPSGYDHFIEFSNIDEFNAAIGRWALQGWRVNRGAGEQHLIREADWNAFEQARTTRHGAGLRLTDIDVATVSGEQRYYGVMRPGAHAEHVIRSDSWADFEQQREALAALGWRLQDFGVSENAVVGLFHRSDGYHAFRRFTSLGQIDAAIRQYDRSMLLVDFECWREGETTHFAALWRGNRRVRPGDDARPPTGGTAGRSPG
jgi:hypothetical protein